MQNLSVKVDPEVMRRLERIAKANGIPVSVVARICLANALPAIEGKISELMNPEKVTSIRQAARA